MKILLFAGMLYLILIGTVLVLRPQLMFTAKGAWKEFGIGRNPELYTWMPFWLFAILSAILSYLIVLLIAGSFGVPGVEVVHETVVTSEEANIAPASLRRSRATGPSDMKPGYYILDPVETAKKGVPKYIYLGPEPPNLLFSNGQQQ